MVKKSLKKLSFSHYPDKFFKLFLPNQSSHHLKFPPAFLECYSGTIPIKSTISTTTSSWQVDLEKIDDELYFCNGWEEFVKDSSLQYGDFLVFSYGGNAKFDVKIYGSDCCQKEAPNHNSESSYNTETSHSTESSGGYPIPEGNKKEGNSGYVGRVSSVIGDGGQKRKSTRCFDVVFKQYHRRFLKFPPGFLKCYNGILPCKSTIRTTESSWQVNLVMTDDNLYFRDGWEQFVEDNLLHYGDFLLFSYNGNAKFDVQVYGSRKEVTQDTGESSSSFAIPRGNTKNENSATEWPGALFSRHIAVACKRSPKRNKTLCFEMVLKKYQRKYLTFPRAFAYGSGIEKKEFVVLKNRQGKIWRVELRKKTRGRGYGRIDTSVGWFKFWDDNNLTSDDKCMFEFVPGSGNIIKVDIFSAK